MQNMNTTCRFKRFDVVSDVSDHDFLSSPFSNAKSRVYKKITNEWRILKHNLPESIFIRVFETLIDLLRAAIVGAAGTPYHDALFFFDIAFPPDCPTNPPKVQYLSFGYGLNPNLYPNGRVCLSLLNTWLGSQSERWNPEQSTLLQVLLSIQSLVLNEKPYFNEPGSNGYGSEKASQIYNQRMFTITCKSTVHLIRKPPKNFEPFVYAHFRARANAILMACEAYVNGRVRVGFHGYDDGTGSSMFGVSREFQTDMQGVYPQLVVEFRRIGAPLGNSVTVEPMLQIKKRAIAEPKD